MGKSIGRSSAEAERPFEPDVCAHALLNLGSFQAACGFAGRRSRRGVHLSVQGIAGPTRGGLEIVRSASHQGFAISRRVEADISRRFVEEFNPAADKGGRQGVPTVRWPLREAVRWPSRATIHDPATASRGNPQEAAKKWWPSDGCDSRPFEAVPPPNRTLRVHRHGPGGRPTGQMDLLSALRRFPCRTPRAKRRLPCVNLTLSLDVLLGR